MYCIKQHKTYLTFKSKTMYYYITKDYIFVTSDQGTSQFGGVKLQGALIHENKGGVPGSQVFEYNKEYEVYIKEPYTCITK